MVVVVIVQRGDMKKVKNDVVEGNGGVSPYPLHLDVSKLDKVRFGWDYYDFSQNPNVKEKIHDKFDFLRPSGIWMNDADTLPLTNDDVDVVNGYHNLYTAMRFFYVQKYRIYNADTKTFISNNENFIYLIGTQSGPSCWDGRGELFKNIAEHTKEYIRKGKVLVVIDMSDEGYPIESTNEMSISEAGYYENISEYIHKAVRREKFPPSNIAYLTSNYKIKRNYKNINQFVFPWTEIIMKNKDPNPIEDLNKWHLASFDVWNGHGLSTDSINPDILAKKTDKVDILWDIDEWAEREFAKALRYKATNMDKMKNFLCLCKLVKDWRLYHSLGLNFYSLHEKGLTSFILSKDRIMNSPYLNDDLKNHIKDLNDYDMNKILCDDNLYEKITLTLDLQCKLFSNKDFKNHLNIKDFIKKLPLYVDTKTFDNVNGFDAWNRSFYDNTFFSYTYNTFATGNDTIYLTEKVWKEIMCFHPFLLVSNPGSLKQLRKLGYKTFEPFIDESYDNVKDFNRRSDKLLQEVNRINSYSDKGKQRLLHWYEKQADILIHNFKHFVESNPAKETLNLLLGVYSNL